MRLPVVVMVLVLLVVIGCRNGGAAVRLPVGRVGPRRTRPAASRNGGAAVRLPVGRTHQTRINMHRTAAMEGQPGGCPLLPGQSS